MMSFTGNAVELTHVRVVVRGKVLGGGDLYTRDRLGLLGVEFRSPELRYMILSLPGGGFIVLTPQEYEDKEFVKSNELVEPGSADDEFLNRWQVIVEHFFSVLNLPKLFSELSETEE